MRSRIFEDAVIHTKLHATLIADSKINPKYPYEAYWDEERVLSKENLKLIEQILKRCRKPQTANQLKQIICAEKVAGCIQYLLNQKLLAEAGDTFLITVKGKMLLALFVKLRGFFGVDQMEQH
ncbi:MAG: hypothetical protein NWF00_03500 [Candidatus Bathyarchaeota archaeon]|nr:hypothetical protein [Candidatus Bathyarchaeota archaeon]